MTQAFCVAIRTFNGEKYLPEILDALQAQQGIEGYQWEVLIVDNCSTDDSAGIVRRYQAQWSSNAQLRYCFESTQGADIARRRAINEANASLIGFLDDDNIPTSNWVRSALEFAATHPKAAAFGSKISGRYEASPPANFERISGFLPVIERTESLCFTKGIHNRKNVMPPGAGLVIRRKIWLECVPSSLVLKGPQGNDLSMKGEDIEALMHIKRAGWEIWYNSEMQIFHHIPKTRFEKAYLKKFFQGIGQSRFYTRTIGLSRYQKPLIVFLYMVNDFRKIGIFYLKYRNLIKNDPIIAGEFELYLSSLISPFSHLIKKIS